MRKIERFDLIDRIGRELQSRMTFDDIDVYLSGFGVDTAPKDRSYNSKWVYTKDLLAAAPEETVIRIADELDLDHPYVLAYQDVTESRFWEPGHLRVAGRSNGYGRCLSDGSTGPTLARFGFMTKFRMQSKP
jgi:hypothetical protein